MKTKLAQTQESNNSGFGINNDLAASIGRMISQSMRGKNINQGKKPIKTNSKLGKLWISTIKLSGTALERYRKGNKMIAEILSSLRYS